MNAAETAARCLSLLGALALFACARERAEPPEATWFGDAAPGEPPPLEPGSFCDVFVRRAKQCGVIAGDYRACVNYGDRAEHCETLCLEQAPCRFFEQQLCAGARPEQWPASDAGSVDGAVLAPDAGLADAASDAGVHAVNEPAGSISPTRRCFEQCVGREPFRCDDGRWLSAEARCDFREQCPDGEDERACTLCADGTLVEADDDCPVLPDCGDGCVACDAGTCQRHTDYGKPSPAFKCRDGERYIRQDWVCNARRDCADGSDEVDCEVLGRCRNRLITRWEYCNGVDDCTTGAATVAGGSFDEPPWCPAVEVTACEALVE